MSISKTKTETEEEIVQVELAQRDSRLFKPLYEKYYKSIFLFTLHRVGDKSLAADITSQVFLKALLNLGKYQFRGLPFSAWLYRIALNECYDFLRKSSRHRFVALDDASLEDLYDEMTAETRINDLQNRLPSILERLSIDELHIIELRFFDRRPFKEVADILGITETYAKVRVYRVLDKMKKIFTDSSQ